MPETAKAPFRILTEHQINACNEALQIHVLDDATRGSASYHYAIVKVADGQPVETLCEIKFHKGNATGEAGEMLTNGVTNEALLAIVADRMRCFQIGNYRCRETGKALNRVEEALLWLLARARDRQRRGVEGGHKK